VRPRRQVLALNLVVKAAALPPALGDTVLALPRGAEGDEGAVLFQVLPARRDGKKGHGELVADERVVCAATAVPVEARNKGEEHLAELARRIKATVADAIPFFEQHVVRESVPMLHAKRQGRGSRLMPHPLYGVELDQVFGVTGLPCRSPLKNLVFAGREVVPGLGIEGEFHAGVQAAAAVGELLGKRELLR
jgi:phytoene dehydrogenase-like protein